ncbi:hypothetical protein HU200_040306 [Digitaria exilis]|uniref:Cytochrome P450 n=1 Tax=Digitaria exilis TaxID=1010633 RepID=A0A835B8F3_9POAL|nr:hypothetical protein HU200_040306 [Digitaria exilis]
MASFLLVCTTSLLLIILSSYIYQLLERTRSRLPPGPVPLPIIGNLLDVASKLPHRSLWRLAERYGPLVSVRIGAAVVVVVSSPSTAREVLKTHNGSITGRRPPDAWNGAGHATNSLFTLSPGRRWRELRRIGAEHLLSPRRLDGHGLRHAMRAALLDMRRRISKSATDTAAAKPVEVGGVAFETMAELMWRAMFSCGLDAATLRELHGVAREAVRLALTPNVSDFFPAVAAMDLQGVRRGMAKQVGKVYELIDQEIDKRRRAREETGGGGGIVDEQEVDLLGVMLDMWEVDEEEVDEVVMNRDTIRTFLTDVFLAAVDSIPSTIEWAMAELLQNREAMKKLKEQLNSVLGSKECVECSDVDGVPYLQAVIKETLRLHSLVPLVPNNAEDTVEIQGHVIPKGCNVIVNLWAIHHNAEVWTNPCKFIPERFLQCNKEEFNYQGTEDFEFMPFSAGKRLCLGLPLATRMLPALLGSLLHHFEWTLPKEAKENGLDMSEKLGLTLAMATPLQAMVKAM